MAQPTNTFDTFDAVGEREDLMDVIYDISPIETPFQSNVAKTTAKQLFTNGRLTLLRQRLLMLLSRATTFQVHH